MKQELEFEVRATEDGPPLAAFLYIEWAFVWMDQYCRTGVVVHENMKMAKPKIQVSHPDPSFPFDEHDLNNQLRRTTNERD